MSFTETNDAVSELLTTLSIDEFSDIACLRVYQTSSDCWVIKPGKSWLNFAAITFSRERDLAQLVPLSVHFVEELLLSPFFFSSFVLFFFSPYLHAVLISYAFCTTLKV